MNLPKTARKMPLSNTAVLRAVWLLVVAGVVGLVVIAVPLRYRMLRSDYYGYGDGLEALGLTLSFLAAYFVSWELLVAACSLGVAALVAWKRGHDRFAMLVAFTLALVGLMPPLVDGISFVYPQLAVPIALLRLAELVALMAVFCLFPNGRFAPDWMRWLLIAYLLFSLFSAVFHPGVLADTAVLPTMRTLGDAAWLFVGGSWFIVAVAGQLIRYRRYSNSAEKQQTKWVLFGLTIVVIFSVFSPLLLVIFPQLNNAPDGRTLFTLIVGVLFLLSLLTLPTTIALAILRYRLWDVDFFLNRTLIYAGLTALVTAVYVLFVGGVGMLAASEGHNLAAFVVATVCVLVGIRPLHRWLQAQTNKIVPDPRPVPDARSGDFGQYAFVHAPPLVAPTSRTTRSSGKNQHVQDEEVGQIESVGVPFEGTAVLRVLWVVVTTLASAVLVASTWSAYEADLFSDSVPFIDSVDAAIFSIVGTDFLSSDLLLGVAILQLVTFIGMGLFLFWRRRDDWLAILTSLMLIAIGVGIWPSAVVLPFLHPAWHLPTTLLQGVYFTSIIFFLALFPDGRFTPPWTRITTLVWTAIAASWLFAPVLNPYRSSHFVGLLLFVAWCGLGLVAQIKRYRHIRDFMERQQMKLVLGGLGVTLACFAAFILLAALGYSLRIPAAPELLPVLLGLSIILMPITIGIATLRYRLYDADMVLNRTLVYGGLSLAVIAIYGLIVGALSALFQSQGDFLFALLATGLIAVLFQPVRERLQLWVNRFMFGERDDPYAALSKLGAQLQTTATPEAMLQSVVETVADTLKLPYVAIELVDRQGRLEGATTGEAVAETVELPLRYQNENVGYLIVSPRSPGESFTGRERQLLADMAAQTGAMAYSVRITAALQRSREKLVLAREEERRRIRRDLHDELGPTLASQTFAIDAILENVETNPEEASRLLRGLKAQNQETVAEIRRLVYELRPPTLDELGLIGSLQAQVAKLSDGENFRIRIAADPNPLPSLSAAVEVAAYRTVLEAMTNVVRHAKAERCEVMVQMVENSRSYLQIDVVDDGVGLPPDLRPGVGLRSMRERAEELGGHCEVVAGEDGGTRLTAVLPLVSGRESA